MNLDAYLDRIGYDGARDATPATLAAIANRHALAIPFENLGVLVAGAPELGLDALQAKLVQERRGGYCYEQNTLLMAALEAIGFDVLPLSARVRYGVPADVTTPRSHMVLCVTTVDGRMLVDAGFGGLTLTAPARIDTPLPQPTSHETVRIVDGAGDRLLQARVAGEWRDVYRFDFVRQLPVDYVQQNWHTATRPGALFANNLVVARPSAEGRHTLFNRTLAFRDRTGRVERRALTGADDLRMTLEAQFGIIVAGAETKTAWQVASEGEGTHPAFA
jgi:N-hydroxyarylamine O-acetyltransferase